MFCNPINYKKNLYLGTSLECRIMQEKIIYSDDNKILSIETDISMTYYVYKRNGDLWCINSHKKDSIIQSERSASNE